MSVLVLGECIKINKEVIFIQLLKSVLKLYLVSKLQGLTKDLEDRRSLISSHGRRTCNMFKGVLTTDDSMQHEKLHGVIYEDEDLAEDIQGVGYD